jgi:hypothetical protein
MMKLGRMRWAGHGARMGKKRNACKVLTGKADGKKAPGRPRHRSEDNIKMDLKEIGWGGMYTMEGTGAGCCEHSNEPLCSINCWEILE